MQPAWSKSPLSTACSRGHLRRFSTDVWAPPSRGNQGSFDCTFWAPFFRPPLLLALHSRCTLPLTCTLMCAVRYDIQMPFDFDFEHYDSSFHRRQRQNSTNVFVGGIQSQHEIIVLSDTCTVVVSRYENRHPFGTSSPSDQLFDKKNSLYTRSLSTGGLGGVQKAYLHTSRTNIKRTTREAVRILRASCGGLFFFIFVHVMETAERGSLPLSARYDAVAALEALKVPPPREA